MALYRITDVGEVNPTYDVRGWEVRSRTGDERIGEVDDVLCDAAGRPRYLDIDVRGLKRHVLLPIGRARADARNDVVWLEGVTRESLERIPEYRHDLSAIDRDYETRLQRAYASAGERSTLDEAASNQRFAQLSELKGIRVASDDPDPSGYEVIAADGRRIGEVEELIVDREAMRVRYLDVDVDVKGLDLGSRDRHILLPVEEARIDRERNAVVVDGLESSRIGDYPVYAGLPIARDFDDQVRTRFSHAPVRDTFYNDPAYDADGFIGSRRGGRDEAAAGAWAGEAGAEPAHGHPGEERRAERMEAAEHGTVREVRIRVHGDDVVVEKRPRE